MIENDYESEESHKAEHALNPNTRINLDRLNDQILRKRIDSLGESIQVSRTLWNATREILEHRDGTLYEDLAFIDTTNAKYKINKDYDYYDEDTKVSACIPNKPMEDMLAESAPYSIIGVHNHPQSHTPSISDIRMALERRYKYGLVICHNGTIIKYSVHENVFLMQANFYLEILEKMVYNENDRKIEQTLANLKSVGVEMEVLR